MTISATMNVREVALKLPYATRIFEELKIDYCCGGDKPLGDACANAGVEVEDLERMLAEAGRAEVQKTGSPDFQKATLSELIGYILDKHHLYTREEMIRLERLIAKVTAAHVGNHPELRSLGGLFRQICADLKPHMFKEEQILFPYIVAIESATLQQSLAPRAPFGQVNNPIRMMITEHETVGYLLRELRALSSNYTVPADGCISYQTLYRALEAFEKDLHQHIHLENNILFPRATELEANR